MGELVALLGFGEGAWGKALLAGTFVTVQIALCSYALGLVIGLAMAGAKLRGPPILRGIAEGYTTVIRGIPEILVILLIYYGGTQALRDLTSLVTPGFIIEIPPFAAGVAALGAISGAYATEIFRGSIQAVPVGQAEAGRALGLSSLVIFFRITLPQAVRLAVPALGNLWLVILKDAALISVVGIRDLVGVAASGAARTREPFTFYLTVAMVFLALSVLSMIALYYMEKRTSRGFEEQR